MADPEREFGAALLLLGRALQALQPYKDDLVLAGGMVPLLYRRHPMFKPTDLPPMLTREADLVLQPRLKVADRSLVTDLMQDAGFVLFEAPGYRNAPGAQYFQDESAGTQRLATTYVELLAPLRGKDREFVEPQKGLRAQALRYLDLLAHEPLEMDARAVEPLQIGKPCPVRLPHPATFIFQKLLARKSGRTITKRANDLAHIFDVTRLARDIWGEIRDVLQRAAIESEEWASWIRKARRLLRTLFAEDGDGPVDVARIYRSILGESAPTEAAISMACTALAGTIDRGFDT